MQRRFLLGAGPRFGRSLYQCDCKLYTGWGPYPCRHDVMLASASIECSEHYTTMRVQGEAGSKRLVCDLNAVCQGSVRPKILRNLSNYDYCTVVLMYWK